MEARAEALPLPACGERESPAPFVHPIALSLFGLRLAGGFGDEIEKGDEIGARLRREDDAPAFHRRFAAKRLRISANAVSAGIADPGSAAHAS